MATIKETDSTTVKDEENVEILISEMDKNDPQKLKEIIIKIMDMFVGA